MSENGYHARVDGDYLNLYERPNVKVNDHLYYCVDGRQARPQKGAGRAGAEQAIRAVLIADGHGERLQGSDDSVGRRR